MTETERPNPDALLAQLKRDEAKSTRGKLKIFFGMSPGVGKTYAMLQAARQKQAEGCEVVVGIVETHGRKETEALLEGMPIMPRVQVEYRGTTLTETDLDAIIGPAPTPEFAARLALSRAATDAGTKFDTSPSISATRRANVSGRTTPSAGRRRLRRRAPCIVRAASLVVI